MKHYILIRFNKGYLENTHHPEYWMEKRVELYKKYCLPSLQEQSCKDFQILLLFDDRTPDKYFDQVNEQIIFGGFAPYLDEMEWTITTRLDNDDTLYSNAVEKIQAIYEEKEMVIGGHSTIKLLGEDGLYKDTTKPDKTPFLSLVEAPGEKKTVYQCPHTKLAKRYGTIKLIDGHIGTHIHHKWTKSNQPKYSKGSHTDLHLGEKL